MIAASAPVAKALPDALAVGAATDSTDSAPDALALTEPPPAEIKRRDDLGAKICQGFSRIDFNSSAESARFHNSVIAERPSTASPLFEFDL